MKSRVIRAVLAATFVLLMPAIVMAAEGHAEHHTQGPAALIPFWINFLIYVAALFFLLRRPVLGAWSSRRERIATAVGGSKAELEAAKSELARINAKLEGFNLDCAKISAEIEHDTKRECEDLMQSARDKAQRIAARAKVSMRTERASAEARLQRELAELALGAARQKLSTAANLESDRRFRDVALNSVKSLAS